MINNEFIKDILQNKNFLMLTCSFVFMGGILTCFSHSEILIAMIFSFILIVLCLLQFFSIRRILVLLGIFYFAFSLASYRIKNYDDLLQVAPFNGEFSGRIVSIPSMSEYGRVKFVLNVNNVNNEEGHGKALVMMSPENKDVSDLKIGERITLKGTLRKPFTSTNPSQFDYSSYLKNFNIYTVIYSNNADYKILKDKIPLKWRILRFLNDKRTDIMRVHSHYLQSPNLEILGGIVFGDDAVSPPDYVRKSFINSGLLHILAASGMNVAFIFAFWFYILRFLRVNYKVTVISGMFVVILYTLMTGLGASVIRAGLMLLFVLAGKLIDRDAHSISLLSVVAVLMLLYNPAYINDVSFQLSFLVTLGLLTTATIFSEKFPKIPNWLKGIVIIPIVAQIWVIPIQMFYFNTISLYSVLANISTVSILSIISFCGFVSSVLAMIKPIAEISCLLFDSFVSSLLNILIAISDFFSNLPYCILQTSHPEIYQIIIYYVMIVLVTYLIKYSKFKHAFISFFTISLLLMLTAVHIDAKNLEVIAFDVGNADSFLIKTPQNKYFFIDTGKLAFQSGNTQSKIIMRKYLADKGIKDVEGIIVTHFDNDHSGGTVDMIENLKVKTLYLNGKNTSTQTAKNIFKSVSDINQKISYAKNNSNIYTEPDLSIKTYIMSDSIKNNEENETSIITLLTYKDFNMLFMGDAGVETFDKLKKDIPHNVEVLKVGHHGGLNVADKSMLGHLGNDVSLISTGANSFGHPAKGTLEILRDTDILRTDMLNSIKISSDGSNYKIYSFHSHDKKYKFYNQYVTK